MKLIAGLGNPGRTYKKTRHNIGFLVIDALEERMNVRLKMHSDVKSKVAELQFGGEKVILAKPQTFMNSSGEAIEMLQHRYKVHINDIWIISDDATMEFGKMRVRQNGSSGGHNGLKSIIEKVSENFIRIRIGVDKPEGQISMEKWVLSKFTRDQKKQLDQITYNAADKIIYLIENQLKFETEDLVS